MTYAGKGKVVLTTTVKLRIKGKTLRLSTIEENLNNGSAFSFAIPHKWRSFTKSSTSDHDGQVSILLGGDNLLAFPTEIERDPSGMALYRSTLTKNCMVYGSVPSPGLKLPSPTPSTPSSSKLCLFRMYRINSSFSP